MVHNSPFAMPRYRIHRLNDSHAEAFRAAPPREAPRELRPNRYEETGEIEAAGPYQAWKALQDASEEGSERDPLRVGDVLAPEHGPALLCTYWGFEEASWKEPAVVEVCEAR